MGLHEEASVEDQEGPGQGQTEATDRATWGGGRCAPPKGPSVFLHQVLLILEPPPPVPPHSCHLQYPTQVTARAVPDSVPPSGETRGAGLCGHSDSGSLRIQCGTPQGCAHCRPEDGLRRQVHGAQEAACSQSLCERVPGLHPIPGDECRAGGGCRQPGWSDPL